MPRKKTVKIPEEQSQAANESNILPPKKRKTVARKSNRKGKGSSSLKPSVAKPQEQDFIIRIDHPSDGEIIGRQHYAIRISCSRIVPGGVEVSIDNSEYQPARESVGYWWFDLCDIPVGEHSIVARAMEEDGSVIGKTAVVKVIVR